MIGRESALRGVPRWIGPAAITASCVFFAARLLWFIDRYAVNVLFWDQWDYLQGLRNHASAWELFSWIHGPHRMGLGYLFIAAVYGASAWDDRADAFATGAVFLFIMALALLLKRRVVGRLTWMDAVIPGLVLTTAQFELFIGTPNAAHGSLPLLLVVVSPFLWLRRAGPLRALLGGLLSFCAAFTGFAIFLVPGLAMLFCADAFWPAEGDRRARLWDASGALLSIASLALFFRGYVFSTAVDCFRFPHPRPFEYVPFAGLAIVRVLRVVELTPIARALAYAGFVLAIATAAAGLVLVLERARTPLARTVLLFSSFSLLFAANTAVGRVCLGPNAALASRYVPYAIPFWLAAWLALAHAGRSSPPARWIAALLAVAFLVGQAVLPDDDRTIRWYSEGKKRWRACFLATGDEVRCNASAGFRVYPEERAPQVVGMLRFLRENRLNLFKP